MKKILLAIIASALFVANIYAQEEETSAERENFNRHTVVLGADVTWIGPRYMTPACSAGPNVGYVFEWTDWRSKVFLSAGVLLNYATSKSFDNLGVKIPLMAGYTFGKRSVNVSPYIGLGLRFHAWGEQFMMYEDGQYPGKLIFGTKEEKVAESNKWATFFPYFLAGAKVSFARFEIFARYEFTMNYGEGVYGHGISTGVGIHF